MTKKLLIVEDDKTLLETTAYFLGNEGFQVTSATDGEKGFALACQEQTDLIILDLALPSLGGLEVCRMLRQKGLRTPIIMITGQKKDEIDKVLGLELGADDYLLKPFGQKELLARINAVLRRFHPEPRDIEEYSFDDIKLNFRAQTALKGKKSFYLTAKEFNLLKLLVSHEGEVVDRPRILNEVWGYDKFPTTRTIDTFIHNLRKKIERDPAHPVHLITVPWSGYKFLK